MKRMWPALRPAVKIEVGEELVRLRLRALGKFPNVRPGDAIQSLMDILRHKPHLVVGPLVIALIVERIALRFEVFPPGGRRGSRVLVRPQADPVLRTAGFTAKIETLIEIERLLSPFRLQEKRAALSRTCA